MPEIIQLEDKYYISVNSSYADNRVKVLNYGDTFGIFDRRGDIKMLGEQIQGIYHNGTRYLSDMELRINGLRPLLLRSSVKEQNEMLTIDLTNPAMNEPGEPCIPKDTLYIGRSKFLMNAVCYEQIRLSNYGIREINFQIRLSLAADFKDIFEVRGIQRNRTGEIYEITHGPNQSIRISYMGLDKVKRITHIAFSIPPTGWEKYNAPWFQIRLGPHQKMNFDFTIRCQEGKKINPTVGYVPGRKKLEKAIRLYAEDFPRITTSHEKFNGWIERSGYDLSSLLSRNHMGLYPYAGVPWYNTAFGRDGIICALQTLWLSPRIAHDVILYLCEKQATRIDPFRDAEPGKIIHEVRGGEMANLKEIPFENYYGSVDSTPLFIMLVGAYIRRSNDIPLLKKVWKHVLAALHWIREYGDLDGDGFVEYAPRGKGGLSNQGWKDSMDSIFDAEGKMMNAPIALCEVQGYVYRAYREIAFMFRLFREPKKGEFWDIQAEELKQKFNEQFWDSSLKSYVMALDGEKKKARVLNSNAGHSLYCGIADEEKACIQAGTLMGDSLFSGWGIRTIGKGAPRYNPMSYHNGSVWPHDVALIGAGFARYGFGEYVEKLTMGIFDASQHFEFLRLPELFCGFDRRRGEGPTNYPVACSPQAWAVGSLYMMLQSCLGLEIRTQEKNMVFHNPRLPKELDYLEIKNWKMDRKAVTLKVKRQEKDSVELEIESLPKGWKVLKSGINPSRSGAES